MAQKDINLSFLIFKQLPEYTTFGLVPLFNGIPTFMSYLMPK